MQTKSPVKRRFVLVHGLFIGGWCWDRVVGVLRDAGHEADAIDLPGHGNDATPPSKVTIDDCADRIAAACAASAKPAILVSHSSSGIWASQAAENVAESVARLVYVTAIVPRDGESLADWVPRAPDSQASPHFQIDEADGTISIDQNVARKAFLNDCVDDVAEAAAARVQPSPLALIGGAVHLSESRFGRIPRAFVRCERDLTIPPATQTLICDLSPCERVLSLDAGHFPFVSAPEELAAALASGCG